MSAPLTGRFKNPVLAAVIAAAGFMLGSSLANSSEAEASHTSGWFLAAKWTSDPPITVGLLEPELAYGSELTNSLNRVVAAAQTWAAVGSSTWDPYYSNYSTYYQWTGSVCTGAQIGTITLVSSSHNSPAATSRAYCSGVLTSITKFNTDVTWYNDASTSSLPAGQHDFQSSVTHELGHAGGFGATHFSGATCPSDNTRATMCGSSSAAFYWRSLSSHDTSVFAYEY
jgi:hypothetical protein